MNKKIATTTSSWGTKPEDRLRGNRHGKDARTSGVDRAAPPPPSSAATVHTLPQFSVATVCQLVNSRLRPPDFFGALEAMDRAKRLTVNVQKLDPKQIAEAERTLPSPKTTTTKPTSTPRTSRSRSPPTTRARWKRKQATIEAPAAKRIRRAPMSSSSSSEHADDRPRIRCLRTRIIRSPDISSDGESEPEQDRLRLVASNVMDNPPPPFDVRSIDSDRLVMDLDRRSERTTRSEGREARMNNSPSPEHFSDCDLCDSPICCDGRPAVSRVVN